MAKRVKATQEHLDELKLHLRDAELRLHMAKLELYKYTANGFLGENEFEKARIQCLQETDFVSNLIKEIRKVELSLMPPPELPLEVE
jgi:hypothetical protein